tara:strand:- start:159 stop:839 length:681 start_codon:yes stop_codon:yes gene_type:complete
MLLKFLKLHNIKHESLEYEMYKLKNNKFYKEGMNIIELMDKTFSNTENLVTKINFNLYNNKEFKKILSKFNARICIVIRQNSLDRSICILKDFVNPRNTNMSFGQWRFSESRQKSVINNNLLFLVSQTVNIENINKKIIESNKNHNIFFSEKLCGTFDYNKNTIITEWSKLFSELGFHFKKNIVKNYVDGLTIKKKYKHTDIIPKKKIKKLKNLLKKNNLLKYFRE